MEIPDSSPSITLAMTSGIVSYLIGKAVMISKLLPEGDDRHFRLIPVGRVAESEILSMLMEMVNNL